MQRFFCLAHFSHWLFLLKSEKSGHLFFVSSVRWLVCLFWFWILVLEDWSIQIPDLGRVVGSWHMRFTTSYLIFDLISRFIFFKNRRIRFYQLQNSRKLTNSATSHNPL